MTNLTSNPVAATPEAVKVTPETNETVTAADPVGKAVKGGTKGTRKRHNAEQTTRELRLLHWPEVKDDRLWLLDGERGGFAQVPRTLSLFSEVIIKYAVKKKTGVSSAAGTTFNVLWLHTRGQGIARIENESDAALEAGYGGERGITTFRKHMRVLKDLGFVDFVEESRGRVKWVLLFNPYHVLKDLYAAGLVEKTHYAAMLERLSAIGSSDEMKGDDHAAE